MKLYLEKILRLFRSVKFTACVLTSLIVLYFLGLVLPQKWMFKTRAQYDTWLSEDALNRVLDFVGFTDIYLSPFTITLLILFFTNLLTVTLYRAPLILKKAYIRSQPESFGAEDLKKRQNVLGISPDISGEKFPERIENFFKKRK